MINPQVLSIINRIDRELKESFENVFIKEKYFKTGYFDISANKVVFIKETKEWKRLEAKVIINQPDLLNEMVDWSYCLNPLNESSEWLDRVSHIDILSHDIINIVEEKRLDEKYVLEIEPIVDMINESKEMEEIEEKTKVDSMSDLLNTFSLVVTSKTVDVISNESFNKASDRIIKFFHNGDIKISDKFKIESEMAKLDGVNWTLFKEGFVEVSWTPNDEEIFLK
jgi:hypothetical protein